MSNFTQVHPNYQHTQNVAGALAGGSERSDVSGATGFSSERADAPFPSRPTPARLFGAASNPSNTSSGQVGLGRIRQRDEDDAFADDMNGMPAPKRNMSCYVQTMHWFATKPDPKNPKYSIAVGKCMNEGCTAQASDMMISKNCLFNRAMWAKQAQVENGTA